MQTFGISDEFLVENGASLRPAMFPRIKCHFASVSFTAVIFLSKALVFWWLHLICILMWKWQQFSLNVKLFVTQEGQNAESLQ